MLFCYLSCYRVQQLFGNFDSGTWTTYKEWHSFLSTVDNILGYSLPFLGVESILQSFQINRVITPVASQIISEKDTHRL